MAEMAGVPVYIVHLSSEDALNQVREARDRGLPAFAETCPQYLLLSIEDNMVDKGWEGAKYVFSPPLRERRNQPKLWDGLASMTLNAVLTDIEAGMPAVSEQDFQAINLGHLQIQQDHHG